MEKQQWLLKCARVAKSSKANAKVIKTLATVKKEIC